MQEAEWFKDWFNSPYYHILYKDRNDAEAASFIDVLADHLKLDKSSIIWDLACGKGRHSIHLNKKSLRVVGTDLSENSIKCALESANKDLDFYVHDMRTPFRTNYFTHVLNLFTSIGYFENPHDNVKVFKNIHSTLKPGGLFVIDFFNAYKIPDCIIHSDKKVLEGIEFTIQKKIEGKKVNKRIEFSDKGKNYFFEEKVSLLNKSDFEELAKETGFTVQETFGNYNLSAFNQKESDRLILILKK